MARTKLPEESTFESIEFELGVETMKENPDSDVFDSEVTSMDGGVSLIVIIKVSKSVSKEFV